jgi:hypothetical protein
MARFYGRVGYGESVEVLDEDEKGTGVWVDNIVEHSYYGDVIRNTRNLREGENLNFDLSVPSVLWPMPTLMITSLPFVMWSGRGLCGQYQLSKCRVLAFSYDWGRCTMGLRRDLQTLLEEITTNVYFQPPTNIQLKYPCIVYKRDFADTEFADNAPYSYVWRYMVTVIDPNPDSEIPGKVARLPMTLFNRFYTVDNLNHDVFSTYF